MATIEKRQQYGYLIKWIIILGDLLFIYSFFVLLHYLFNVNYITEPWSTRQKGELFLLLNLSYFLCTSLIPSNTESNIVFFDRIIERTFYFSTLFWIIFALGISFFSDVELPLYVWLSSYAGFLFLYTSLHVALRIVLKKYRKSGKNYKKTIIVGFGLNGEKIFRELSSSVYGYRITGVFDDNEGICKQQKCYRGTVKDVIPFCAANDVDEIYCTLPGSQEEKIMNLLNYAEKNMIRFFLVPDFYKYIQRRMALNFLSSVPVLQIRKEPLELLGNRTLKRFFDIVFSVVALLTVFPIVYLICGLLIKLESRGPVLFTQMRTGLQGKVFKCYKFRSMRQNDDSDNLTTSKKDPRITRIGNFMRRTSLDEIPQFINVLLGDMSVVGPRPHMIKQTEIFNKLLDSFMIRHVVKPGLTGWAQISGYRGEIKTMKQMRGRFNYDVWYIENWTFFLDIKIIFITVYRMIAGDKDAF